MKALILAGGRGKRMGEMTDSANKCMLVFEGKPILEYNLDRAVSLGAERILIVVGYKAEEIINRYGIQYRGKTIQYIIQSEQRGLVHALDSSRAAIGEDDFFLLLGDEILINSKHQEMMEQFLNEDVFGLCGVLVQKDTSKIRRTYSIMHDENNRIFRLIEKPRQPVNNLQGTGHCIFKNAILSYIERTPIHPERGEKELPDLIQCAIDDGRLVKFVDVCDEYTNINSEEDLKEVQGFMQNRENSL